MLSQERILTINMLVHIMIQCKMIPKEKRKLQALEVAKWHDDTMDVMCRLMGTSLDEVCRMAGVNRKSIVNSKKIGD